MWKQIYREDGASVSDSPQVHAGRWNPRPRMLRVAALAGYGWSCPEVRGDS